MKLHEIKQQLVERFFSTRVGVALHESNVVMLSLGKIVETDFTDQLAELESEVDPDKLSEVTDALKQFTKHGDQGFIQVIEDDGSHVKLMFAAARNGSKYSTIELTENSTPKISNLSSIKAALEQSKKLNEDMYFIVSTS
jgi:hypothetical protein